MFDFSRSFIEQALNGELFPDEIDTFVERWHEGGTGKELHDYLGLSWDEFCWWGMDADQMPLIIAARHQNRSFLEAANDNLVQQRLAARSDHTVKIARLSSWLSERGTLSE